jgi:hypothetical protein
LNQILLCKLLSDRERQSGRVVSPTKLADNVLNTQPAGMAGVSVPISAESSGRPQKVNYADCFAWRDGTAFCCALFYVRQSSK